MLDWTGGVAPVPDARGEQTTVEHVLAALRPDCPRGGGMTRAWAIRAAAALAVIGVMVTAASADEGDAHLSARLSGFAETPPILTAGSGSFRATVNGNSLTY